MWLPVAPISISKHILASSLPENHLLHSPKSTPASCPSLLLLYPRFPLAHCLPFSPNCSFSYNPSTPAVLGQRVPVLGPKGKIWLVWIKLAVAFIAQSLCLSSFCIVSVYILTNLCVYPVCVCDQELALTLLKLISMNCLKIRYWDSLWITWAICFVKISMSLMIRELPGFDIILKSFAGKHIFSFPLDT